MSRNQGTSAGGAPKVPRVVALLMDGMWTHDLANAIQAFGDGTPLLSHAADLGFVSSGPSAALDHGITVRTMPIGSCHEVPDLICVPGFADSSHAAWTDGEEETLSWLCRCHAAGFEVASLGTSAFVLAQAGLLDGVRCTTHHVSVSEFRRLFPAALLMRTRYSDDPDRGIRTSADGASGLDLCISPVMHFSGHAVASEVAEAMGLWNPQRLCLARRERRGDTASEPCDAHVRKASQDTALRAFSAKPFRFRGQAVHVECSYGRQHLACLKYIVHNINTQERKAYGREGDRAVRLFEQRGCQ